MASHRLVAVLILAGWLAAPARADRPLQQELAEAAKVIAKNLRDRSDRVALGEFKCNDTDARPNNYGAGIYLTLSRELDRLKLRVDAEARFVVNGTYRIIVDASSKPKLYALKVALHLSERGTDKGFELRIERAVVDEATVAQSMGVTVSLAPEQDETRRKEELTQQLEKKPRPPHVEKGRIFAKSDSPYGMEILVKRGGGYEPIAINIKDDLARIDLKRDDVYAVRLINNSDHEAAVDLTIDGLELFTFSDLKAATLILKPKSTTLVKGWPRTLSETNEFLVTSYAKSGAFQLKSTGAVGVISASFAAAWAKGSTPPHDEPSKPRRGSVPTNATGHGAPVQEKYETIERKVGVLRSTVSVRYSK